MLKNYLCFLFLFFPLATYSQDLLDYRFDFFGSITTGQFTPFWMTSNTYGTIPLLPNNGYIRGDLKWEHFSDDVKFEMEADVLTAARHTSSLWFQQLYAAVFYRNVCFSLGAKERYISMLDKNLSMGDMTFSTNARPIPEFNFSFPNYIDLPYSKGYLQFKADFAVGRFMDSNYILRTKNPKASYTSGVLLHHKSLFIKWEDPTGRFPFFGIIGLEHAAQWGGTSSGYGKNPTSLKDFVRILFAESGGSGSDLGSQANVLGNHLGTYNIKIAYNSVMFQTALYKQHYFEDNSGTELANWRDGIWGGELTFFSQPFLKKIVFEYLQTTNQSGPFHFPYGKLSDDGKEGMLYDWVLYPNARGGGGDDYYNHYFYGWSYFGQAIGSPLLTSPEYNSDRALGFKNTRVKAVHFGLEGQLSPEFAYRTLFTKMSGWGTHGHPFLKKEDNFSSLLEGIYRPNNVEGWQFGVQLSFDSGDLYGNSLGCSLKISKEGIMGKR